MIIKSAYETINRLIKFIHYSSAYVDVWYNGFGYSKNFEDTLLDLLANCNKIENIDYSKFIVYIMLSKFCPNIYIPILPHIAFPNTLKTNNVQNLTILLMYYKKRFTIDMENSNLEIHSYYVVVENNLIASTFLNLIAEQEYKYIPQVVFVNSFAYYLCLLF
jgi:adenine-specific DNA methylase